MSDNRISLAAARVNAGMTVKRAAMEAKISGKTLSQWERGITNISAAKLNELASMYGIPVDCIRLPEKPHVKRITKKHV